MNYFSKLMHFILLAVLMNMPAAVAATAAKGSKETAAPASQAAAPPQAITFNRLLKVAPRRHLPPMEDGIRDPANSETQVLQPPLDVFPSLPQTSTGLGNGVNWPAALYSGKIKPRWDLNDPTAEAMVMDMNVVRVPKSTMPDVVFPHKQHTEWLDCSNCHPAIFVPQQGANQISMAAIILGQKCGVCHGKVAFPVSECTRCHSQPKQVAAQAKGGAKP